MLPLVQCAVLLVLLAGTMLGQQTPVENGPNPVQEQLAPDDMVILITGACQTAPLEFAVRDCVRGVTRQEFETLIAALNPRSTPQYRERVAELLGEIIILSNEAKRRGLSKDPEMKTLLQFAQMQELANLLISHSIKKDASNITDADIGAYYQAHLADYQNAEFLRLTVPRQSTETPEVSQKYAESIRARCSQGEDPAKLEVEADEHAGQPGAGPVDLKNQRPATFPAMQQTVFRLKPGECALLEPDKTEFYVYKMIAVDELPLSEVRNAIASAMEAARVKSELDELKRHNVVSLNNKYFAVAPAPSKNPPAAGSPK